jgi:hypothetical protein
LRVDGVGLIEDIHARVMTVFSSLTTSSHQPS